MGSRCENSNPSEFGQECQENSDCNSVGQICDTVTKQCRCDGSTGFVLDEFQPSLTYGECIGPVPTCTTSKDCEFGQSCESGFCKCLEGFGDMCPKDGIWECVSDPLPQCLEGILPDGRYGCCDQIESWRNENYDSERSKCFAEEITDPCDAEPSPCGYYGQCLSNGDTYSQCSK